MIKKNIFIQWLLDFSVTKWRFYIPNIIISLALLSSILTIAVLNYDVKGVYSHILSVLVRLDVVFLLFITCFLIYRVTAMFTSNRRGEPGNGLQRRLSSLFALLTLAPTVAVTVFSLLFFDLGLKTWFSERVAGALNDSQKVAYAYLLEHRKNIIGDALGLAREFDEQSALISSSAEEIEKLLVVQGVLRNLTEALVFDLNGKIYGRYGLTGVLEMEPLNKDDVNRAKEGEVVIFTNEQSQRVRALVKLNSFEGAYIVIGRFVDPKVIGHIQSADKAIDQYLSLEKNRDNLQFSFTLVFLIVVMLLLATAIWLGLATASTITRPIMMLIDAADKFGKGRQHKQLDADLGYDEISKLMTSFNTMTSQLDNTSNELNTAYTNLEKRSDFIETLLEGLSTGVIALDEKGEVLFMNAPAMTLLNVKEKDLVSKKLMLVVAEFYDILSLAIKTKKVQEKQISYGSDAMIKKLFVRVGLEKKGRVVKGYVVSFDDVGALETAQKNSAWADIARRIAHEIKNPLTPIQLSAERLNRKYNKILNESDKKIFNSCTDIIVRQVEEIGRLVDEFSSFGRMPKATMLEGNIVQCVKQSYTLQRTEHDHIKYTINTPDNIIWNFDNHQIGQMITNLMKNSFIAMESSKVQKPKIHVTLKKNKKDLIILVEDNGDGFPVEGRKNLLEPYISFAKNGTGLGLSIVKKVVEDHGGVITLMDSDMGGASVEIIFKGKKNGS